MSDQDPADVNARMRAAMADAVQQAIADIYEGNLVTRWIVLAEVIEPEGERALVTTRQEDMRAWDSLGMLTFAVQLEQAALTRDDS